MNNIIIRDTVDSDVDLLQDRLKEEDVREVWASHHLSPREALIFSIAESSLNFTVDQDGIPIIVFGIIPEVILGDRAMVWLLSAELDRLTKLLFLKNSKPIIEYLLNLYPYLYNYVDTRNTSSLMWLKYCGAIIEESKPYGVDGLPFNYFHLERR